MPRHRRLAVLLLLAAGVAPAPRAQQSATDQPAPTLRVQTRLVVEDVLVTDKHGDPVHNLPVTAFHLTDNGKPQQIESLQEGSPDITAPVHALPPGTFTNALPAGPPPATEVLLIDTDDIATTDQMFLGLQLKKAIAAMPSGVLLSLISVRGGRPVPLLLNTTDRTALLQSVNDVVPVVSPPVFSKFQSAVDQLMGVAALLQQIPGRKNVLWFAGEFPLVAAGESDLDPTHISPDFAAREHLIHLVQEALSEARISIYPIDVRGVLVDDPAVGRDAYAAVMEQHGEMRDLAASTGGRSYVLNNLAGEIDQAVELGKSAYALSYTPSGYATDDSWHRVAITVDGGYTVSYRRGYMATWSGVAETEPRYSLAGGTRTRIDPNRSKSLTFQARVEPDSTPSHVTLRYSVPLDDLSFPFHNGLYGTRVIVSAYACDANGRVKTGKALQVEVHMTPPQYAENRAEGRRVAAAQTIDLPKSAKYLLLNVRDLTSQRTGSILLQTRALTALLQPSVAAKHP